MEKADSIYEINAGKYRLIIIYNKLQEGLYSSFSSDRRMYEYIQNHIENAFSETVQYYGERTFLLNIASTANFGAFEWRDAKDILDRQLQVFMPIIQRFMVGALTDSLPIIKGCINNV